MKFENKIKYYDYYLVEFELVSALCIADGEEFSDKDVMRDLSNVPYIPASSIVGVCRDYLKCLDKDDKCIFGSDFDNNFGIISPLIVSDVYLKDCTTDIRDGIKIKYETKQTEDTRKYEYEVVNPYAKGELLLELVVRENDELEYEKMKDSLRVLYNGFNNGEIRLGSKKTRGLGKIQINTVKYKHYGENDKWWEFSKQDLINIEDLEKLNLGNKKYDKYEVNVDLQGGLIIRTYPSLKDELDYAQMTVQTNDGQVKPVIMGTSINGALRHRMKKIMIEIIKSIGLKDVENKVDKMLEEVLGSVEENSGESAISKIIIDDAYIEDSTLVKMVRTSINRFDQSVKKGALYKSMPTFKGATKFAIYFDKKSDCKWAKELFMLAIKDMDLGYLPIGGETAIGRGMFKVSSMLLNGENIDIKQDSFSCTNLIKKLNKGAKNGK